MKEDLFLDLKIDSTAFNCVRDRLNEQGRKLSKDGKDLVDAMVFANRTGVGKTVNQFGEERIYGGARQCGKTANRNPYVLYEHELPGGSSQIVGERINKESEEMYSPKIELETDTCGRYHYAKAVVYRDVETKRKGCYKERILGYGVARRQHGDPKDMYVGEGLAVSRALEDLGFKLGKRAWGKVKHNDDIKVMRRQQKERRQAKAKADKERYETFSERFATRVKLANKRLGIGE